MNVGDSSTESFKMGESHELLLIKKLKKENKKLSEENLSLLQQLSKTKRQFQSAVAASRKMDDVKKKNTELEREIVEIRSEKADLESRLQIALKTISESEKKPETNYKAKVPSKEKQSTVINKEKDVSSLLEKIASLEDSLQREKYHTFTLQSEADQIYASASQCFATAIKTPQNLMEHLFSAKKLRDELKSTRADLSRAETRNRKLKSNLAEIDSLAQQKIRQMENDYNESEASAESYRTKFNSLQMSLKQIKENVSSLTLEKEKLIRQNDQQKQKYSADIEEERQRKNKEAEMYLEEVKKLRDENCSLAQKKTETQFRIETLESEIRNTQEEISNSKKKTLKWKERCHKAEDKLTKLLTTPAQPEIDPKDEEIFSLKEEIKTYQEKCRKLEKTTRKMEEKEEELQITIKDLVKKVKEAKKQQNEAAAKNQIDQIAWTRCQIPSQILSYINEVSSNPNTPISTKVQQIINAIIDFTKDDQEKNRIECENAKMEAQLNKRKLATVSSFISRLFPDIHVNYDSLAEEERSREVLIRTLDNRRADNERIKTELQELQSSVSVHFGILGVETFADAKSAVSKLLLSEKRSKKEIKNLKQQLHSASEEVNSLECSLKKMDAKNFNLQKNIVQLNDENQKLAENINELENLPPDPILTSENNKLRKRIREFDNLATEMASKLKETEESLKDAQSEIEKKCEDEERIAKQNKKEKKEMILIRDKLIDKVKQQKEIIRDLKKQLKNTNREYSEQNEKLNRESEKTISSLRQKVDDQEREIEQLSSKNIELTAAMHSAETKFAALIDEKEREKKQLESQLNAKLMSLNSNIKDQIEEANLNNDLEVKQLIQTLIHTFPFLYDGAGELSKGLYEKYLSALKEKFDEMSQREFSIRAILGITARQSIEQAINELKNEVERTEI